MNWVRIPVNWVRTNFIPSIDYIVLSYFKDLFKDLFSIIVDKHAPIKKISGQELL